MRRSVRPMATAYETWLMRKGPQHALCLIMRHMEPLALQFFKSLPQRERLALGKAWRKGTRSLAGIMAELRDTACLAAGIPLESNPALTYNPRTRRIES